MEKYKVQIIGYSSNAFYDLSNTVLPRLLYHDQLSSSLGTITMDVIDHVEPHFSTYLGSFSRNFTSFTANHRSRSQSFKSDIHITYLYPLLIDPRYFQHAAGLYPCQTLADWTCVQETDCIRCCSSMFAMFFKCSVYVLLSSAKERYWRPTFDKFAGKF